MKKLHVYTLALLLSIGCLKAEDYDLSRVITIGGPVTETVWALGMGEHVVAIDQSSTYPSAVMDLPDVGYIRQINAEGVLSMNPSLILTTKALAPETAANQILNSGVPIVQTEKIIDLQSTFTAIDTIAAALGKEAEGSVIKNSIQDQIDAATALQEGKAQPRVALLMNHGGRVSAAGQSTKGHGIVSMAGGENIYSEFRGYKEISVEALLKDTPDVILIARMGVGHTTEPKELLDKVGLGALAAIESLRVYEINMGLYMSFGPRTGQAVYQLTELLYE